MNTFLTILLVSNATNMTVLSIFIIHNLIIGHNVCACQQMLKVSLQGWKYFFFSISINCLKLFISASLWNIQVI